MGFFKWYHSSTENPVPITLTDLYEGQSSSVLLAALFNSSDWLFFLPNLLRWLFSIHIRVLRLPLIPVQPCQLSACFVSAASWSCSSHREVNFCGRERSCFRFCSTRCLCFTGWVSEKTDKQFLLVPLWYFAKAAGSFCVQGTRFECCHLIHLFFLKSC